MSYRAGIGGTLAYALDAMHSFDEYRLAESRPPIVVQPAPRNVCLRCGHPYEKEEP